MGRRSQNRRPGGAVVGSKDAIGNEASTKADIAKTIAQAGVDITKKITQAEVKVDVIRKQGMQIVEKLEAQARSLEECAEQYLEQGLLGHHLEAQQMRDAAMVQINATRKRFGMPLVSTLSKTTSASTSEDVAASPSKLHEPQVGSGTLASGQDQSRKEEILPKCAVASPSLAIDSREEVWSLLAATSEVEGPRYRWRKGFSNHLETSGCTLEVRGNICDVDVDISESAIRLQWPRELGGVCLRLPLGFLTQPEDCQAMRRRRADALKLLFPRVSDIPPQAPILSKALMSEDGHGFVDGFMAADEADIVRDHLVSIWKSNQMQTGEIAGGDKANEKMLRSDKHVYMDDTDPVIMRFTQRLDRFMMEVSKDVLDLKSIKLMRGRPMAAVYSGAGSRYVPHFDAVAGDNGRVMTCIMYLNPFWRESDGAQLRLWPQATSLEREGEFTDIAPLHGRLMVFLCNSRNLHEVLPVAAGESVEPRVAISCWYYDSDAIPAIAESVLTGDAPLL